MPESSLILTSALFIAVGVVMVLFPRALLRLNAALNYSIHVDAFVAKYRHVVALLLFAVGYGVFRLALLLPTLLG